MRAPDPTRDIPAAAVVFSSNYQRSAGSVTLSHISTRCIPALLYSNIWLGMVSPTMLAVGMADCGFMRCRGRCWTRPAGGTVITFSLLYRHQPAISVSAVSAQQPHSDTSPYKYGLFCQQGSSTDPAAPPSSLLTSNKVRFVLW